MKCPRTGFVCDEPVKYQAKIMISNGAMIVSEGVAELRGRPLLFCDRCKGQVSLDVLISDDSWLKICEKFKARSKPIPHKSSSKIEWLRIPRLQ